MDQDDLISCVEVGLDSFGAAMKEAIYCALQANDGLDAREILEFPDALVRALRSVFGSGYVFAERSIIREMQKRFELTSPTSSYTIPDAFRIAGREIRRNSRMSSAL
jgi:hypothetical protein